MVLNYSHYKWWYRRVPTYLLDALIRKYNDMESLVLGFFVMLMIIPSQQMRIENLEDTLFYSLVVPKRIQKRDAKKKLNETLTFVEEKLIEHGQALEQLIRMVQNNEEITARLVENISKKVDEPRQPEKVEVLKNNRRSNNDEENVHPLIRLGKNISIYGKLFKSVILKDAQDTTDPIPYIEHGFYNNGLHCMHLRSFNSEPVENLEIKNTLNKWCPIVILCHKKSNPVCGYDDSFGYGIFEDICHMFQVNSFWKYNFSLLPNCQLEKLYSDFKIVFSIR